MSTIPTNKRKASQGAAMSVQGPGALPTSSTAGRDLDNGQRHENYAPIECHNQEKVLDISSDNERSLSDLESAAQLENWVYEVRDVNLTVTERLEKLKWEASNCGV